jgi:hypothetical protein
MNLAASHGLCPAVAEHGQTLTVRYKKGDHAMENYDPRRRQDEERHRARQEDHGRDRDSWWRGERSGEDDRPRRAERGGLDPDRDYGRPDEREGRREGQGYRQSGGSERSRFSPDWSREGAEPRYSDDPYYSRNREHESGEYSSGDRFGARQSDDRRVWEQRARESIPREQRELAERSGRGDYYDPSWPYERSGRGRDEQRSREDEQGSHYRGFYSRSTTPFAYPGGSGYLYSESVTLHGPYTGRGPKGYKRSDQQIIEDACQRLERDGEIDASEIEVSAEDGVIRLRGTVPDRRAKRRAEECVESIYGARDVMNELRVEQQGGEQSQGRQAGQGSQAGRSSASQASAQGTQGSQVSSGSGPQATPGSSTSAPGGRPGAGSPGSDQPSDDKRSPRH